MGGGCVGVIEAVSAHSDADTVYFGLGGSNGGNHLGVCDFVAMRNVGFCNKEHGVGSVGHTGADAFSEAS